MTSDSTLNQPIRIPFGGGIDIPPPSARTAMRVHKIMAAINKAAKTGNEIDISALAEKMGVADPDNYDMNVELLGGPESYERLLDALNVDEMSAVQQAVFIWIMPGGGKAKAEAFLADPTAPPAPPKKVVSPPARKKPGTSQ